jgi:hypothetical protein
MSECGRLTDRMPLVALGREWTPAEQNHLDSCSACQAEWELVRRAQQLGSEQVAALNPEELSRAVLQRLRGAPVRRRRRVWLVGGLGLAASLAALLLSREFAPVPTSSGALAGRLEIPLPELEDLEAGELDSVLTTMDEPLAADTLVDSPEPGDLNDEEFDSVLDTWEG